MTVPPLAPNGRAWSSFVVAALVALLPAMTDTDDLTLFAAVARLLGGAGIAFALASLWATENSLRGLAFLQSIGALAGSIAMLAAALLDATAAARTSLFTLGALLLALGALDVRAATVRLRLARQGRTSPTP